MVLILAAAFCMALLFLLFKVFHRRGVPLLPTIVINYFVALACGTIVAPAWEAGALDHLVTPVLVLGILFITLFYLTGISTQLAGVAATSVASKMSLVLTVAASVVFYDETPGPIGWAGIALALVGVVLSSWPRGTEGARGTWLLPLLLFLGNAAIDIVLNHTQRMHLKPETEAVFPTLVFGVAGVFGLIRLLLSGERGELGRPRVLLGGVLLGSINYASLYFIVGALARSGLAASSVFPLMNIGVILFGTAASMAVFRERLSRVQWIGVGCAVLAMMLILQAG
jgi:drug/metabolite transporter (DMT)-like permease